MSCYEGLCELYRVTGEKRYREVLLKVFDNIRNNEISIVGSGSDWERWFRGRYRQTQPVKYWMETCVTVTWMKLCYQLLRLSSEPRFADEIERSAYNALVGAMKKNGTWWSHYSPLMGIRGPAHNQCKMNQNCCVVNGPRAMMLLPTVSVMLSSSGPVVNLYCEGTAIASLPSGNRVRIKQKTDYPLSDTIVITVRPDRAEEFTLSLRIPSWSKQSSLKVNGNPSSVEPVPGTYAVIKRPWERGDKIELKFDLRARVVPAPGNESYVAIMRGPVVLALNKRLCCRQTCQMVSLKQDSPGYLKLVQVKDAGKKDVWMAFNAACVCEETGKEITLTLCDYASAGNTWDDNSRLRVWLAQPLDISNPLGLEGDR